MVYVTSDLHGFPFPRFRALLDKAGFGDDDFLFILGDVIDRNNDGGVSILKWLLFQPNVQLILGNHEAMLLACDFMFEEITDETIDALRPHNMKMLHTWKRNGADPTIDTLRKISPETRTDILEYLRDAPLYETVSTAAGDFLLVHGGLGGYRPDKKISEYTPDELLWTRPTPDDQYSERFTTILGHTPTRYYGPEYRGKILKTKTWINIDTGAAGGLPPALLRLDDMREFYIDN